MAFEFSSPPNLFDASKLTTGTLLTGRLPALSGDIFSLVGSNLLYLVDSGVIAGTYTNASLIVDSKGRILSAGNGTPNSSITSGGNVEFSGSLDSGRVTYSAVGDERFFPTNSTLNVYLSASQNLYSSLSSGYIALSSSYAGLVTNYNYLSSIKENLIIPGTTSQYYRGDKTFQTLDKNAVGLSNVDNTSDADKPISNATQAALNAKAGLDAPVFTGAPTITNFTNAPHSHTNFSNGGLLSAAAIGYGTLNPSLFPAFSGDITTNIGGVSANLSNTGVIAGIYSNASISVDSKGRILSAGSGALDSGNSGGATTGDVKFSIAPSLPGWVNISFSGTIGNAGSGALLRANADAAALFALIWNNVADAEAPIYDSVGNPTSRGVNAAADFAALKRLTVPSASGRTLVSYDPSGSTMPGGTLLGLGLGAAVRSVDLPTHNHEYPVYGNSVASVDCNHDGSTVDVVQSVGGSPTTEPTGASGSGSNPADVYVVQPSLILWLHIKL